MKKFLSPAILLFLFSCTKQQISLPENTYQLKGRVKTFSEASFEIDTLSSEPKKGARYFYKSVVFDEKGYELEIHQVSDFGKLSTKTTYSYDKYGNKIGWVSKDDKGKVLSQEQYRLLNGKLVEAITLDERGNPQRRRTTKYNRKGQKTETLVLGRKNAVIEIETYKYDDSGQHLLEINLHDHKNRLLFSGKFQYDTAGNETESLVYDAATNTRKKNLMRYDDKGNIVEIDIFDQENQTEDKWSYRYEYDSEGNWIKRTSFHQGIADGIDERVFTYFDKQKK